ncbi:helicase associated domain-containing protein [Streptomyces sp. NPDC056921]|uniref:helicase associated domain-containing protein n=1 Tax=Streptomyces sp. NPDC056921 TaxID=3345966 RepID=UPI003638622E
MFHKFAHRETLRNLGRVPQALPTLGKWAWLAHPRCSQKAVDAHIKAALTEHEAIAARREELAEVRAGFVHVKWFWLSFCGGATLGDKGMDIGKWLAKQRKPEVWEALTDGQRERLEVLRCRKLRKKRLKSSTASRVSPARPRLASEP